MEDMQVDVRGFVGIITAVGDKIITLNCCTSEVARVTVVTAEKRGG